MHFQYKLKCVGYLLFYVTKTCQFVSGCRGLSNTPPDSSKWSSMHHLVICKTTYSHKLHKTLYIIWNFHGTLVDIKYQKDF